MSVVGVAPYYIDTPFLGEWADWSPNPEAQQELANSAKGKKILRYYFKSLCLKLISFTLEE